jgi:hypothetical protein
MVRRYGDPVEVRPAPGGHVQERADPGGVPPGSFLWHGRLYVVRSVLGHWCERRAWWTAGAARALHGGSESGDRSALGAEREVWRVEAGTGRSFGVGVYDLCHDPVPEQGRSDQGWLLLRVSD